MAKNFPLRGYLVFVILIVLMQLQSCFPKLIKLPTPKNQAEQSQPVKEVQENKASDFETHGEEPQQIDTIEQTQEIPEQSDNQPEHFEIIPAHRVPTDLRISSDEHGLQESQQEDMYEETTPAKEGKTRTVSVSNAIKKKSLGYSYLFINYQPTLFTVSANGTEIDMNDEKPVTIEDGLLEITYYCEFKDGDRKSSKKYIFNVEPDVEALSFGFNWHKDPRIIIQDEGVEYESTVAIDV